MRFRSSFRHSSAVFNLFAVAALFGMLFALPGISTIAAPALNQTGNNLPPAGKVIVVLKEGTVTAAAEDVAVKVGVRANLTFNTVFNGFAATVNQTQLNKLAADSNVAYIAQDVPMRAAAQTPSTAISRSQLTGYSQINGGGDNVNVDIAVIDTGIDASHPDLNVAGNLVGPNGTCARNPDGTAAPIADQDGHGTHVAGIAGAIDNSFGVVGAAPGARLWNGKALYNSGVGQMSWVICAIDATIARGGIEVINMSIAGASDGNIGTCANTNDPLYQAVCAATSSGIMVVVAAGNNGRDVAGDPTINVPATIPALYPEVLAVANVGDTDGQPGNDSLNSTSNYGAAVKIAAPGTQILSTVLGGTYGYKTGTSMASPLVAGTAAIHMAYTGDGAGATRNWLLSTGSQPQNSSVGWSPPAPTGSPNRFLYLGSVAPPANPPGTINPSFDGGQLPITNSLDSPNTGTSAKVRDGVSWTNWATSANYPASAILTLDLGSTRQLTGVKWLFSSLGYADAFEVRVSSSYSGPYQSLGSFGNGTATYTWFGVGTSVSARFIQFVFMNPAGDAALGAVGEIEVWGAVPTNPPGTLNPSFSGSKQTITNSLDSPSTGTTAKARDGVSWTNWATSANTPATATITFDLGSEKNLSGVKWMFAYLGYADQFTVRASTAYGGPYTTLGTFGNAGSTYTWYGIASSGNYRFIQFVFTNIGNDPALGSLSEVEIWGSGSALRSTALVASASPEASPVASSATPVASPEASPVPGSATPVASPAASPEPVTEGPLASPEVEGPVASPGTEVDASPVVDEPIDDAAATPVLEEPTETAEPTEITDQVASPEVVEPTATETLAPTGTEPTAEPTAAISTGFISGTDGDSVNCRLSPVDGEVIASLTAGDVVDVTGPVEDGWYPVSCDGRAGYVAADYITLGSLPGEAVTEPTSTVPSQSDATPTDVVTATIEPTLEPTATVEPTETPYPIYDTGDTETSNTAWLASDDDASTYWSVYPSISPEQTRLYLDLGSVLPIDRITIELAVGGMLPVFEIWLSEDAATWYNATPQGINGWNLWADEAHVFRLGYDARYIRLVIPNVDESGLGEVGGIRQVTVWPGDIDETQFLTALGSPTTPTPAPVPKEDVIPTDVPVPTIAGDVVPTTEPTPADDGGQGVDSNQQDQALPPGDGGGVEKDGTPTDAGS